MKRIAVSGASGLVGAALVSALEASGYTVARLVRSGAANSAAAPEPNGATIAWDPGALLPPENLRGYDAVVHLAGENIASGRWTDARKQAIRDSRVNGTRMLAESLAKTAGDPRTLVCASAIGYYGSRGDEILIESSAPGSGFLAEVCREWEAATQPASATGIRVANLRFGVILARQGGMLKTVLVPFRLGVGGKVGSGRQFMSWIALPDVVAAIMQAIEKDSLAGPINVVAPNPVTNAEFTAVLGKVLSRPTVLPLPAVAVRTLLGEMGENLLLGSQRVEPARLLGSGYEFKYPQLEGALRSILR